jgi:hypothetical protein
MRDPAISSHESGSISLQDAMKMEETMLFEVGAKVKWKNSCPIRLGLARSGEGKVVGLHGYPAENGLLQIDVAFDTGEVIHGAEGQSFEQVHIPSNDN